MNKKNEISWERIYLYCLFIWSFSFAILNESTVSTVFGMSNSHIYMIIWDVIKAVLGIKIMTELKILNRNTLFAVGITILGIVSYKYSQDNYFTPLIWFLVSAKGVKTKDAVRTLFYAQLLCICSVGIMALFGVAENIMIPRSDFGAMRYSMGFPHPNIFAGRVLQLCLMHVYLREKRLKLFDCAVMLVVAMVVHKISDSRTVTYLIFLLILLCLIYMISNRKGFLANFSKWTIKSLKYMLAIFSGLSIYLTINYGNNIPGIFSIDDTFSSRIEQMHEYFTFYKINLFGQPLASHYTLSSIETSNLYTLDNGYLHLLLGFGIVIFVLFLLAYFLVTKQAIKDKNYIVLIIIAVYAVYGFSETMILRFSYNFSLILFSALIWKQINSKRILKYSQLKRI